MGGHGFVMMGLGLFVWLINLFAIGIVVYLSVKLALRKTNRNG